MARQESLKCLFAVAWTQNRLVEQGGSGERVKTGTPASFIQKGGTMERLEERILIRSLECETMLPRIKILFQSYQTGYVVSQNLEAHAAPSLQMAVTQQHPIPSRYSRGTPAGHPHTSPCHPSVDTKPPSQQRAALPPCIALLEDKRFPFSKGIRGPAPLIPTSLRAQVEARHIPITKCHWFYSQYRQLTI